MNRVFLRLALTAATIVAGGGNALSSAAVGLGSTQTSTASVTGTEGASRASQQNPGTWTIEVVWG
ncbi:MAG: hypothetical protein H6P99_2090 [Holophagaceae bacterium]|nr:hypothetical protein [Holophagaceae bacterium]